MADTIPNSAAELDGIAIPLYQAMGRAIARWQYVECGMFILSHAIMQTQYKYSSVAFYMLKGADMKQQLLSRLCEAHFTPEILEREWKPIKKQIKSGITFRNGLAHFEVSFMPDRQYLGPNDPPVVLCGHHLNYAVSSQPFVKAANMSELNQAASEWLILSRQLLQFVLSHFSIDDLRKTELPFVWVEMLSKMHARSR